MNIPLYKKKNTTHETSYDGILLSRKSLIKDPERDSTKSKKYLKIKVNDKTEIRVIIA